MAGRISADATPEKLALRRLASFRELMKAAPLLFLLSRPARSPRQNRFQFLFHLRPLCIEDAVVDRVANVAVPGEHVAAMGAFHDGADSFDGALGPCIARIRFQLHPYRSEFL